MSRQQQPHENVPWLRRWFSRLLFQVQPAAPASRFLGHRNAARTCIVLQGGWHSTTAYVWKSSLTLTIVIILCPDQKTQSLYVQYANAASRIKGIVIQTVFLVCLSVCLYPVVDKRETLSATIVGFFADDWKMMVKIVSDSKEGLVFWENSLHLRGAKAIHPCLYILFLCVN